MHSIIGIKFKDNLRNFVFGKRKSYFKNSLKGGIVTRLLEGLFYIYEL